MVANSATRAKGARKGPHPAIFLSAAELRDRLAAGEIRAAEVAQAFLDHIAEREPEVQAWAWLDGEHVTQQARALDAHRLSGKPIGPLHGVPVALKDVIDTRGMPTENGTPIDKGRTPTADAYVVRRLKAAGAIILGKTVSTELAYLHPGKTRNPVDPAHTPGGSSSGSAAAVAAHMAPLAIGTQTGGSIIRPAAYCGIVGFKPTFGAIPRTGVLAQAPSLDTMGVFARTIEDAAMLCDVLFGDDAADAATEFSPPPRLFATASAAPPVKPMFAFVRPPGWEQASSETHLAMQELTGALGDQCFEAVLPNAFAEAAEIRDRICFAELAKFYYTYERRGRDQLSPELRDALDKGKAIPARDYIAALDWPDVLYAGLGEIFERCDAILTPATPGPAPRGLESTGSPIFNGLWTLCRTPAVTVPLLQSESGLPMGVQLVGARGNDARLLRTARWLAQTLSAEAGALQEVEP